MFRAEVAGTLARDQSRAERQRDFEVGSHARLLRGQPTGSTRANENVSKATILMYSVHYTTVAVVCTAAQLCLFQLPLGSYYYYCTLLYAFAERELQVCVGRASTSGFPWSFKKCAGLLRDREDKLHGHNMQSMHKASCMSTILRSPIKSQVLSLKHYSYWY